MTTTTTTSKMQRPQWAAEILTLFFSCGAKLIDTDTTCCGAVVVVVVVVEEGNHEITCPIFVKHLLFLHSFFWNQHTWRVQNRCKHTCSSIRCHQVSPNHADLLGIEKKSQFSYNHAAAHRTYVVFCSCLKRGGGQRTPLADNRGNFKKANPASPISRMPKKAPRPTKCSTFF